MTPTFYHQSPGEQGILEILAHMQRLVNRAYTNPYIRQLTVKAMGHCQPHDKRCQAASILAFIQRHMQFIRDPQDVEALIDPVAVAKEIAKGRKPYGDCDDFSMIIAAMLKSVGLPATFRAVGLNGGNVSHVYVIGPYGMKLDATTNQWSPQLGELLPETSSMERYV